MQHLITCRSRPLTSHFSRPTTSTTIRETSQPQRSAVSEELLITTMLLILEHDNNNIIIHVIAVECGSGENIGVFHSSLSQQSHHEHQTRPLLWRQTS